MSIASDKPHHLGKTPVEGFKDVAAKYEFDGIAEDGSFDLLHSPLGNGSTRNDQRDMQRMGKDQQLMVSADCQS
jgi:hypothetical protein